MKWIETLHFAHLLNIKKKIQKLSFLISETFRWFKDIKTYQSIEKHQCFEVDFFEENDAVNLTYSFQKCNVALHVGKSRLQQDHSESFICVSWR